MMDELTGGGAVRSRDGGLTAYLRRVWAVAQKDVRTELRAKEIVATMAAFAVLAAVIFGLAFDLRVPRPELVVPGILWVIILFTGVLGLQRSFGSEIDRGTLTGLLLAPVERSALYCGKVAANLLYFLIVEALLTPTLLILFDVNLMRPMILLGAVLGHARLCNRGHFVRRAHRSQPRARGAAADSAAAGAGAPLHRRA